MINEELKQKLQDAVDYIESLHDAIDSTLSDTGKEVVYQYQGVEVNFDAKEAKALLSQLEKGDE